MEVTTISLSKIKRNENQPRKHFDEDSLKELSESIKKDGIMQPITVRKVSRDTFEIVQGERRYRACKLAGLSEIPAIIKELDDEEAFRLSVIENIQREDMSPIEEALAFQKFIDMGYTHKEIAEKISKGRTYVTQKLRLLNLNDLIKHMLSSGKIAEGHARQIMKMENIVNRLCGETVGDIVIHSSPFELFQNKFYAEFHLNESISVKDVTEWINGWHYKLVRSIILNWMDFGDVPIISAGQLGFKTDITAEMMCINYGLSYEKLTEDDLSLASKYEREALNSIFDDELRPWMIDRFYDSIKFERHPLFNTPLKWTEPKAINYVLLITSEKDEEGNLVVDENKMNEFIEKSTADDKLEVLYLMYQFVESHTSSYIDPLSIKSVYSFVNHMNSKGFENWDDADGYLTELEQEHERRLRNAEELVWTCYYLEFRFNKSGNDVGSIEGAIRRLKREINDFHEGDASNQITTKEASELFYSYYNENVAEDKLNEFDQLFSEIEQNKSVT